MKNGLVWILAGVGIAAVSILFMDPYFVGRGVLWNLMYGEIYGVTLKYPMAVAIGCVLFGVYLRNQRAQKSK